MTLLWRSGLSSYVSCRASMYQMRQTFTLKSKLLQLPLKRTWFIRRMWAELHVGYASYERYRDSYSHTQKDPHLSFDQILNVKSNPKRWTRGPQNKSLSFHVTRAAIEIRNVVSLHAHLHNDTVYHLLPIHSALNWNDYEHRLGLRNKSGRTALKKPIIAPNRVERSRS